MFLNGHGRLERLLCLWRRGLGAVVIIAFVIGFGGGEAVIADDGETQSDSNWIMARGELFAQATTCLEQRDALCLLRQAKAAERWIEDRESLDWLSGLRARVYAELGYFRFAHEAAAAIQDDVLRAETLGSMAGDLAERGDPEEARSLLREAEASLEGAHMDFDHVEALAAVGWAHAKLGDKDRAAELWRAAKAMWDELGAPPEQFSTIYELAWGKIDAGATSDALSDIEWLDRQVPAPKDILKPLRFVGHIDGTGRLHVTQIPAGEPGARANAALLYALAGLREPAGAAIASVEALIADWKSLRDDEHLLVTVAQAQAALRRIDDALATARSIGTTHGQAHAFCRIALEQREAGDLQAAADTVELIWPLIRKLENPAEFATIAIRLADALN
jgi:tetratricopeptide (TPR) repeat protein